MSLSIIVHGGAKAIPPEEAEAHRRGCLAAVRAGWFVLREGGSPLDAVEAAIRALEDDPTFNAGLGSDLNADGQVRMDAGLMEGRELQVGAVGSIQGVRNPISVARRVLEEKPVLMVGPEARLFAAEKGAELCPPEALITEKKRREWEDMQSGKRQAGAPNTVGCVALDAEGNLACGASTGGTGGNPPGRVGDSALAGCGFYAEHEAGACSMTGDGEDIVRVSLARTVVDFLGEGYLPDEAAARAIQRLQNRVGGEAGCILLDCRGRIGWAHNAQNMAVAYLTEAMDGPAAFLHKEEEARQGSAADGR